MPSTLPVLLKGEFLSYTYILNLHNNQITKLGLQSFGYLNQASVRGLSNNMLSDVTAMVFG